MILCLLLLVFAISQGPAPTPGKAGEPPQQKAAATEQTATNDQRGTEQTPLVVKVSPADKTKEESAQEAKERDDKAASDWWTVRLTGSLAAIAFLQLLVYGYQAKKLRETVESAGEQSAAMERHIGEAARSASAMENVVSVITSGNHAALRAYLTVIIGSGIFQERREGLDDLKFEAKPLIVNTGGTPARKVSIRIAADILTIPIPEDFHFPLPEGDIKDAGTIGAHQNSIMSAIVKDLIDWGEVGNTKKGIDKALCVWGTVSYEDIFGGKHETKFGQTLTWQPNGTVYGYYIFGQNDAD